jgi:heavy metal sensor kinase
MLIAEDLMPDHMLLQVGKSTEETTALLARFRNASVVLLAIFFPASIVVGALFAARALRPIQALTRTMLEIQATSRFDARMPSSGTGDELDRLVQVFNQMLARIERLIRGMRESLDNVAHDLRTPMTRLRGKAQTALLTEANHTTCRETLADCIEESERVMHMLNTLMDIAEAEAGVLKIDVAPVDAAKLVASVLDLYAPVAEDKEITLTADVSPDLRVQGDAVLLRRVFANLVENAIKFTPRGGAVRLDAQAHGSVGQFIVVDTGAGIPSEDLPRIWDRLYRGDRSRSERGLGLGLSLVKAIVERHGGATEAESTPGAGTRIYIELPLT